MSLTKKRRIKGEKTANAIVKQCKYNLIASNVDYHKVSQNCFENVEWQTNKREKGRVKKKTRNSV